MEHYKEWLNHSVFIITLFIELKLKITLFIEKSVPMCTPSRQDWSSTPG